MNMIGLLRLVAASAATLGLTQVAFVQPATASPRPVAQGAIAKHLKSVPYIRVLLPRSLSDQFLKRYLEQMDGHIAWELELPDVNARLVAVDSHCGNVSAEFSDSFDALPVYAKQTRAMYVCDDIDGTLKAAKDLGLPILQQPSSTTAGMIASFELVPGYVVQVVALNEKSKGKGQH